MVGGSSPAGGTAKSAGMGPHFRDRRSPSWGDPRAGNRSGQPSNTGRATVDARATGSQAVGWDRWLLAGRAVRCEWHSAAVAELLTRSELHVGAVRGRYFRENFAQGGIDLVQIVPELVTNADAAIAASGRAGRIELRFASPEPEFLERWRAQMHVLRVPALVDWRFEVRCSDDGVGVTASLIDTRLGALCERPDRDRAHRRLCGSWL